MAQKIDASKEFSPVSNEVCVIKNCYKYKGIVLEEFCHKDVIPTIKDMTVNPDDTFIVSYPRTGMRKNVLPEFPLLCWSTGMFMFMFRISFPDAKIKLESFMDFLQE